MFSAVGYNQQDIVKDGLVLWLDANDKTSYPGTGTVWTDLSRGGNNGTLINGPTYNSGNGGNIVFDGTNDYASCGNQTSLNSIVSYTVSLWVKMSDALRAYNIMFARRDPNSNTSDIEIYTGNGGITWVHNRANAGTFGYTIFTTITNNTNTLLTFTYNSSTGTWTTYFNGSLSQQVTTSSAGTIPVPQVTPGLYTEIGRFYYGYGSETIYDYFVYNRALSLTEIQQNYNATKPRFGL